MGSIVVQRDEFTTKLMNHRRLAPGYWISNEFYIPTESDRSLVLASDGLLNDKIMDAAHAVTNLCTAWNVGDLSIGAKHAALL